MAKSSPTPAPDLRPAGGPETVELGSALPVLDAGVRLWRRLPTLVKHLIVVVIGALVFVAATGMLSPFRDYQIAEVAAYVAAVAGVTVLIGLSGQISVGNGAFMAIGAYVAALMLMHFAWLPLIAVVVIATCAAAVAGGIFGVAAARLRGPYLAGATLMLAVALPALATRFSGVFGGDQGIFLTVNVPSFLGVNFQPTEWQAWFNGGVALIVLLLLANLTRSRVGRNWRALRDDEVAAALAGLNVARLQIRAFIVSAACAGAGGVLLAIYEGGASTGTFSLGLSIQLLTAAVLGGLGSLGGAIWGSALLVLVPIYLEDVATSHGISQATSQTFPIVAYGVVLIAVMLVFPKGIQGGLARLSTLGRRRPPRENQEKGTT
jgi:branched-chain amino acid transport system permease protein